jgi:hypothetical protein
LLNALESSCLNNLAPNIVNPQQRMEFENAVKESFSTALAAKHKPVKSCPIELISELSKLREDYENYIQQKREVFDLNKTLQKNQLISQSSSAFTATGKLGIENVRLQILKSLIHTLKSAQIILPDEAAAKIKDLLKDDKLSPTIAKKYEVLIINLTNADAKNTLKK